MVKTIASVVTTLYEIKNSKFITILYKIDEQFNLDEFIQDAKELYPKATHYCYAYRTMNMEKSYDDGELLGCAGQPMLNVLIHEDLVNVLCVTVRYFGGIKLGAGGLVRAYTKSVTTALTKAFFQEVVLGYIIKIKITYDLQKKLDYLLNNNHINYEKEYDNDIAYTIKVPKDKIKLLGGYKYEIIKEELIEK